MNPWHWLTTADPTPGFTPRKILRIAARFFLFVLLVTLLQLLLALTPLGPYTTTWWGQAILVLAVYLPFARFLSLDLAPVRPAQRGGTAQTSASARRRKERNRYAGVRKGPPGGRR